MKRLIFLSALTVLAMALVACGGGDGDGAPETATLAFEGNDELRFVPASASVPAGSTVDVTLTNTGALEHTWVLVTADVDVNAADVEAQAIGGASSGIVPGGESTIFSFEAPAVGTYQYVCTVPGHAAAGMVGTLTVQ